MSGRWSLGAALTAFAMTLALLAGQHLSSEALILLLGVAIGCGASWPGYYWLFRLASRPNPSPIQMLYPPPRPNPQIAKPLPPPRKFLFLEEESAEHLSVLILK